MPVPHLAGRLQQQAPELRATSGTRVPPPLGQAAPLALEEPRWQRSWELADALRRVAELAPGADPGQAAQLPLAEPQWPRLWELADALRPAAGPIPVAYPALPRRERVEALGHAARMARAVRQCLSRPELADALSGRHRRWRRLGSRACGVVGWPLLTGKLRNCYWRSPDSCRAACWSKSSGKLQVDVARARRQWGSNHGRGGPTAHHAGRGRRRRKSRPQHTTPDEEEDAARASWLPKRPAWRNPPVPNHLTVVTAPADWGRADRECPNRRRVPLYRQQRDPPPHGGHCACRP